MLSRLANYTEHSKRLALLQATSFYNTRVDQNEIDINSDSSDDISGGKINNKIANLSSSTNKMSTKVGLLIFKDSLAFTHSKKMFIKVPVLYHFNPKRQIQIKANA